MVPPFAPIDLSVNDPIPLILASPEFQEAVQTFANSPSIKAALLSPDSQALLYSLIRLMRPDIAIEIGTYMASTTEAMALAVAENGSGRLHTVDPFGAQRAPPIIARWPSALRAVTELHLTDSMLFFWSMQQQGVRADLVFVDGNHDYEFALFDIQCAARLMNSGGFVVIDNIAQPGPFFAARDFMERAIAQGWCECGNSLGRFSPAEPFDRDRTTIHNTDFCVLRAPRSILVGNRPIMFGDLHWTRDNSELRLRPAEKVTGKLHAQFVIRIFESMPREIIQSVSIACDELNEINVPISFPPVLVKNARQTVEPWLTWEGSDDLRLTGFPTIG
jgi:predicted O-methyltransferase YrrM